MALSTPLNESTVADTLASKQFAAGDIAPGARRSGYLYFPLATYTGARVPFVDRESGEAEGVRVEF